MKIRSWAVLWLVVPLGLAGCKNFWNLPTGSGTGTGSTSGVFYVLNQTTGQVVAYDISSGTLTTVGTYSVTGPTALAVSPNADYLYVSTLNGIYAYSIGSGGALTLENNGQVISDDIASAIAVDTTSGWLVDAYTNAGGQVVLDAIPLNSSGTYTSGSTVATATFTIASGTPSVKQMVLSSDDDHVFVALGTGGTLIVPFSSSSPLPSGVTANTISVLHGGSDLSVAVDPSNRLFYIGETLDNSTTDSGGLRYFDLSTLTEVSGSPLPSGGIAPNAILPLADGDYVYVANGLGASATGSVAWFPVSTSGSTVSLSSGSSLSSGIGIQPIGLAEDSTDTYVLMVSEGDGGTAGGDPDLEAFTMSSGALTSYKSSDTGTDPVGAIAIVALP
jgi:6-phosphogluconolactonase (cycloisomerase 2 family)